LAQYLHLDKLMKKRFKFQCWNCLKTYTLFREITNEQELIVACPFCSAEAVVKLEPFRKKIIPVLKRTSGYEEEESPGFELQLPEIFPTQKPD
jgi:DNA-directed RNA polymerase subunit RPC12/RpoP